jgi:hypothetical protein
VKAVVIKPYSYVPSGSVYVMADTSHPEVSLWTTIDEADALIIACHPDHEQIVRDVVAIEQERPRWWRDLRAFEAAIASASSRTQPTKETS